MHCKMLPSPFCHSLLKNIIQTQTRTKKLNQSSKKFNRHMRWVISLGFKTPFEFCQYEMNTGGIYLVLVFLFKWNCCLHCAGCVYTVLAQNECNRFILYEVQGFVKVHALFCQIIVSLSSDMKWCHIGHLHNVDWAMKPVNMLYSFCAILK